MCRKNLPITRVDCYAVAAAFHAARRILRVCPEVRVNGPLTRAILATIARAEARARFAALYELANDSVQDASVHTREGRNTRYSANHTRTGVVTDNEKEKRALRGAAPYRRIVYPPSRTMKGAAAIPDRREGGNKTAQLGVGEPAISGYRACSLRVYYWPCNYC